MRRKRILVIVSFIFWLSALFVIFRFTSDPAVVSDQKSLWVASLVKKLIARNFYVNPNDEFWTATLNPILRKCGHFAEYFYLGVTTLALLLQVLKKKLLTIPAAVLTCVLFSMSDEYRQSFIPGRSPQWSDVLLDSSGAMCGIVVVGFVFLILWKIRKLKNRIRELEGDIK